MTAKKDLSILGQKIYIKLKQLFYVIILEKEILKTSEFRLVKCPHFLKHD